MAGVLEVGVEVRDQRAWEMHGWKELHAIRLLYVVRFMERKAGNVSTGRRRSRRQDGIFGRDVGGDVA